MSSLKTPPQKPLLRGHFHQAAFFYALGAWSMLLTQSQNTTTLIALIIYGIGLNGLFGISALYHRPKWQPRARTWMRRLDHSAIFLLIAGTFTPICLLILQPESGLKLLVIVWIAAALGICQSLFWIHAPKWLSALLYVAFGSIAYPYLSQIEAALGFAGVSLLLSGGIIYTLGAVVYALKKPDPYPRVFGYHEIFHVLVIIGAILHFIAITRIVMK